MKSRLEILESDFQPAHITVLYEDLATALRANALLECPFYCNQFTEDSKTEFWRFDLLKDASQRRAAVRMAERSRLVVVSALSQNSIQPAVESCVSAWLEARAHQPGALAVLFSDPNGVSRYGRTTVTSWWQKANEQRMRFYCDLPEWQSDFLFGARSLAAKAADQPKLAAYLN